MNNEIINKIIPCRIARHNNSVYVFLLLVYVFLLLVYVRVFLLLSMYVYSYCSSMYS
jgi:hypothetical protein